MSNTDSFIEEVTEEVQRDKLFGLFRKYGWIGIAGVVLLVGGAAYNEYSKSNARQQAEATGDAILAAISDPDAAARAQALAGVEASDANAPLVMMLRAGELADAGEDKAAVAALAPLVEDANLAAIYRDLAVLKTVMLGADTLEAENRLTMLAGIAAPGAPYRLLAEEQIAVVQIETGEVDAAIEGLRAISEDNAASTALRRRAVQMIVALGGDPIAAQGE